MNTIFTVLNLSDMLKYFHVTGPMKANAGIVARGSKREVGGAGAANRSPQPHQHFTPSNLHGTLSGRRQRTRIPYRLPIASQITALRLHKTPPSGAHRRR